jgi:hypothetical protein
MASPKNKEQQITTTDCCYTQEDFIVICNIVITVLRVCHNVQVIEPKKLIGKKTNKNDAYKK